MKNTLTLDQHRSRYAWEVARKAAEMEIIGEYRILAKSVASLIMNSGLMQTLAFLQAKEKKTEPDHHRALKEHLCRWLGRVLGESASGTASDFPPESQADFCRVMEALHAADSDLYMRATSETMALLRWIRQLADACNAVEVSR